VAFSAGGDGGKEPREHDNLERWCGGPPPSVPSDLRECFSIFEDLHRGAWMSIRWKQCWPNCHFGSLCGLKSDISRGARTFDYRCHHPQFM